MFPKPSQLRLPTIAVALCSWVPGSFAQNDVGSQMPAGPGAVVARADIRACGDTRSSVGLAYLRERPSTEGVKEVDIMVRVWTGLLPGKHAVHIHEKANCQPCSAAGGHFDPGPHSNSNPDGNHPFHSGDLVNLNISGRGRGLLAAVSSRVSLSEGPLSLFDEDGSAFIIHHQPDSYCPEGVVSGCAGGSRAACGVIVRDK